MKKIFLFFTVTIILMIFVAVSTLLAAEAIDCPRALGNLCEDPSVEKLTDEEAKNTRAPGKASGGKGDINEFVRKRFLMSPPIR